MPQTLDIKTIQPSELPDLLMQLQAAQAQDIAILNTSFSYSQEISLYWQQALAGFKHIYRLSHLSVNDLRCITQWQHLQSLCIYGFNVERPFLHDLSNLAQLKSLSLVRAGLKGEDAKIVADLQQLRSLSIAGNDIGAEGAQAVSGLSQLKSLDIGGNGIGDEGAQALSVLSQLTSLDISHNDLGVAGAQAMSMLEQLSTLSIGWNSIGAEGAQALSVLIQLTSLDISNNDIGVAGADVVNALSQLRSLYIGKNGIGVAGAGAVSTLSQLTSLDIGDNDIGAAGAEAVSALSQLTLLYIDNNGIGAVGAEAVSALSQLKSLHIGNNDIGLAGAEAVSALSQLKSLHVGNNDIGVVGTEAVRALSQLRWLNIGNNDIGVVGAEAISALSQLRWLNIGNNDIGIVGAEAVSALSQLTWLNISDNDIGVVGAEAISALNQLRWLHIGNNDIGAAGAEAVSALSQLTWLYISNNDIGAAGAEAVSALSQLTFLDISDNGIGSAGTEAVSALSELIWLNIVNNNIGAAGAEAVSALSQLTWLHIGNNDISAAGAEAVSTLSQLTFLDVSDNSIGTTGAEAVSALSQLTWLYIGNNDIGSAGAEAVSVLSCLTLLDISYNNISGKGAQVLSSLNHLQRLNLENCRIDSLLPLKPLLLKGLEVVLKEGRMFSEGINVQDCPIKTPPPEIVKQGREAILNYFSQVEFGQVDHLYEAKVLVLGDGGHGKTSLIRRLYLPEHPLPQEDESTKGIDIHRSEFAGRQGKPFALNVWDFGGQQIYHATHQFFLTKRSLYILVDDTRNSDKTVQDKSFKYWLEVIETLAEKSPVLIFQNEKSDRSKIIDIDGIQKRFPNVVKVVRGNLEKTGSVVDLKCQIEHVVQDLAHVGDDVPKAWLDIRKAIEQRAKTQAVMTQQDYFTLYKETQGLEWNKEKALQLSQYFHDLGVFLHFQEDLRLKETVILKNTWATDAVFKVLDDEQVKSQQGQFKESDCCRLWQEASYEDKHVQLLALMEKFELCYQLPDTIPARWLVPQLLQPSKPKDLPEWPRQQGLNLYYRYEFLPKGLVNRLMVRMHRYVLQPQFAWYNGVLFEDKQGSQVLAQVSASGREIQLAARGSEAKTLLHIIASDLDALNQTFKNLKDKTQRIILCPCNKCLELDKPYEFKLESLMARKRKGKATVECDESYEDMNVMKLLEGFSVTADDSYAVMESPHFMNGEPQQSLHAYPEAGRHPKKKLKSSFVDNDKIIKIFLASSSELESDRDAFDLYFRQKNDMFRQQGIYLKIERWETALNTMSQTRLQDRYNKMVRDSDIVVCLFKSKTGQFTHEEFEVAFDSFKNTEKPKILTYFREQAESSQQPSLEEFKAKLLRLGHFYTVYKNIEDLKLQFRDQLEKLQIQEEV